MRVKSPISRRLAVLAVLLLAACSDNPVAPTAPPPAPGRTAVAALQCTVTVADGAMRCTSAPIVGSGASLLIMGGQDTYVKLASAGTEYDAGAKIFRTYVTVENLIQQSIGTPDSSTVTGVSVFFSSGPMATAGTGSVAVQNPTGTDGNFTGPGQTYFLYDEIIPPYKISSSKEWRFQLTGDVTAFSFKVYVSADIANTSAPPLGPVWNGGADTGWNTAANWQNGTVPDSNSTVMIPSAASVPASPTLPASKVVIANLRVAGGGILTATDTLQVRGNADILGTLSGGTLQMSGSDARLNGTMKNLVVTGNVTLQGTTTANGAVTITNGPVTGASLTLTNYTPISIINHTP
jgi:hypothetical protein